MKRILWLGAFVVLGTMCSAQVDADVRYHVTVLTSAESPRRTAEPDRVVRAISQLLSILHYSPQQLPNIVVIYAGDSAARVDGLPTGAKVTVARITMNDRPLYQIWVSGEASDSNLVEGLVWALNRHFDLKMTNERVDELRTRIVRQLGSLVSVSDLGAAHSGAH